MMSSLPWLSEYTCSAPVPRECEPTKAKRALQGTHFTSLLRTKINSEVSTPVKWQGTDRARGIVAVAPTSKTPCQPAAWEQGVPMVSATAG